MLYVSLKHKVAYKMKGNISQADRDKAYCTYHKVHFYGRKVYFMQGKSLLSEWQDLYCDKWRDQNLQVEFRCVEANLRETC